MRLLRTASLRQNIVANVAGSIWTAALGFLFIPIYVKYLGIEAYGLVGFYVALQAIFGIVDLGLGATLNREMARLSVQPDALVQQRHLLRTLESLYWGASLLVGGVIFLLAQPFAAHWVHVRNLPQESIIHSVRLMGCILALQFPFAFYQGGLMGLQQQTLMNSITVVAGTLRSVGAVLLLAFVSPSIVVFFGWQFTVTLLQTGCTVILLWRLLSGATERPVFQAKLLRSVRRFSAVVAANAILGTLLTQLDKVLLSRFASLSELGYYAVAGSVAAAPWMVITPINAAFYPRFAQAAELRQEDELARLYHRAAQLIAVALFPLCISLIFFSREFVIIWTGNLETASKTAIIISFLVAGSMINGIVSPAGFLQSASGWPELTMYTNAAATIVIIPAMAFMTVRYGAKGAAAVWCLLNTFYLLFTVPLMHRRILRSEKWRWYVHDVALPLAGVVAVVLASRLAAPFTTSRPLLLLYVVATWSIAVAVCVILSSEMRREAGIWWGRVEQARR